MISPRQGSTFKVVLVGSCNTGKTSIIQRLLTRQFKEEVVPTIGAGMSLYESTEGDPPVTLNVWDTAGQDDYRSLGRAYYRSAAAAVLVFDVTSGTSFSDLDYWKNELEQTPSDGRITVLVGNKIDQEEARVIQKTDAENFAKENDFWYRETSAMTGAGVTELFEEIAEYCRTHQANRVPISAKPKEETEEKKCC